MIIIDYAYNQKNSLIYFDYNVFVRYMNDQDLQKKIDILKEDGFIFPYSPAHIEEIANINSGSPEQDSKYVAEHISALDKLSGRYELFPNQQDRVLLVKEDPWSCLGRVNNWLLSLLAELNMRNTYNIDDLIKYRKHKGYVSKEINNIKAENFFEQDFVKRLILESDVENKLSHLYDKNFKENIWEYYNSNFQRLEEVTELLFRVFDLVGFYPENKKDNVYRSKTHDVSHTIYASQTKYFITLEKKQLFNKAKAIYSFLNVETEILNCVDMDKIQKQS